MAKRRKKSAGGLPAKGRLRDFADELWALAVKEDWGWRCAVCRKSDNKLDAHHLIRRQHERFKYSLENGMALCFSHHRGRVGPNPHLDAAEFLVWLRGAHPERHKWYMEITELRWAGEQRKFNGTKNQAYYLEVICSLREYVEPEEFERIVGVKLAQHLEKEV
jgi:hypothetical protein